jgi:hypothetical protein
MEEKEDWEDQLVAVDVKKLRVPPPRPDTQVNFPRDPSPTVSQEPWHRQSRFLWGVIGCLFLLQLYSMWRIEQVKDRPGGVSKGTEHPAGQP